MIINKFYEKLYKELINKLESDYILIPNTPENRKAINNTLTAVPCTVKSLEKDSKIFKALSNKKAKAKQLSIVPKISKTLSLIIIATLICMPFNTINTLPTPTYHPTVQVSILDISDGSSHQKGKNKLSEIQEQYTNKNQEQRNPKNYKKKCRKLLKLLLKMNLLLFKYVIIQRFIDFYSDYRYSFRIMKS